MTIMNMLNGYVGNFVGNVIALSIVCWFSYQSSFAINAMMTFVAISLSGIAEGLIAIAVIMITGSINGNIRIYALIAKIIFWMIVRVLALLYKGKVEKSQRKIYGIILSKNFPYTSSVIRYFFSILLNTSIAILLSTPFFK